MGPLLQTSADARVRAAGRHTKPGLPSRGPEWLPRQCPGCPSLAHLYFLRTFLSFCFLQRAKFLFCFPKGGRGQGAEMRTSVEGGGCELLLDGQWARKGGGCSVAPGLWGVVTRGRSLLRRYLPLWLSGGQFCPSVLTSSRFQSWGPTAQRSKTASCLTRSQACSANGAGFALSSPLVLKWICS